MISFMEWKRIKMLNLTLPALFLGFSRGIGEKPPVSDCVRFGKNIADGRPRPIKLM